MPELPQAQDTPEPQAGEVSGDVLAGLVRCKAFAQTKPPVGADSYAAVQPGAFSAADKRELKEACRYEIPDSSGRRCALCKKCLHRDIAIEGSRAIFRNCNRTFTGW